MLVNIVKTSILISGVFTLVGLYIQKNNRDIELTLISNREALDLMMQSSINSETLNNSVAKLRLVALEREDK